MKRLRFLAKYLRYYRHSWTKHDVHSPFVFELLTKVIEDKTHHPEWDKIEKLRKDLLKTETEIKVLDLGAGSQTGQGSIRKISEIVRNASKSPKYGRLLARLAGRFKPEEALELGTSLGLSALYQASLHSPIHFRTLEGCPATAEVARQNFKKMNATGIQLVAGNFDEQLPACLNEIPVIDYVFFDGNHRKEPTLRYFRECAAKAHEGTYFVFDDIHWSEEMEEAWTEICSDKRISVSIDLFFLGIVFFRKGQEKQHFMLRF